jgi:hypothetical protein
MAGALGSVLDLEDEGGYLEKELYLLIRQHAAGDRDGGEGRFRRDFGARAAPYRGPSA